MRILIVKTGYCETFRPDLTYASVSFGDVLRSTPILHLFKNDEVHWLTDIKAVPLLYGLKEISQIHLVNTLDTLGLETYFWDTIINLESSRGACQLVNKLIQPHTRVLGYYLDSEKQKILTSFPYTGNNWSERLFSLLGEKWKGEPYLVPHKKFETEKNLVFLNRSVGPKLPEKYWTGWDELERVLLSEGFKTSSQKSLVLEDFIIELQKAEYIISTDSLGLHIALALKKPLLGLFGPTNAEEVPGIEEFIQKPLVEIMPVEVYKKFRGIL